MVELWKTLLVIVSTTPAIAFGGNKLNNNYLNEFVCPIDSNRVKRFQLTFLCPVFGAWALVMTNPPSCKTQYHDYE